MISTVQEIQCGKRKEGFSVARVRMEKAEQVTNNCEAFIGMALVSRSVKT